MVQTLPSSQLAPSANPSGAIVVVKMASRKCVDTVPTMKKRVYRDSPFHNPLQGMLSTRHVPVPTQLKFIPVPTCRHCPSTKAVVVHEFWIRILPGSVEDQNVVFIRLHKEQLNDYGFKSATGLQIEPFFWLTTFVIDDPFFTLHFILCTY